jgi:hypothetical protein
VRRTVGWTSSNDSAGQRSAGRVSGRSRCHKLVYGPTEKLIDDHRHPEGAT